MSLAQAWAGAETVLCDNYLETHRKGVSGNPKGRPKGLQNKLTREIRTMVWEALSELGGVEYLVEVGRRRPDLFCALIAKLIPAEVRAPVEQDGVRMVEIWDYTGRLPGAVRNSAAADGVETDGGSRSVQLRADQVRNGP